MKILQVFNQYRFRGGEEMWVEAIPGLLRGVAEVVELRFQSSDWVRRGAPGPIRQALWIGNNPESRRRLREAIEEHSPDMLLLHNVIPVGSLGLYEEARRSGVPVAVFAHNFRPFSPGGTLWQGRRVNDAALRGNLWPEVLSGGWQDSRVKTAVLALHLRRLLGSGMLQWIDHWFAPSAFMRRKFVEAGVPEDRISVVRHCYEGELRGRGIAESGADVGERHFLYLGRLERDKGVELLLKAWRRFREQVGREGERLVIAGTGGLESVVKRDAGRDPSILAPGFISGAEKQKLLAGAKAVVIPSICWESLGLTAFEGYASGRPVIASRCGALAETVQEGVTGWFFAPGDVRSLAETLAECADAGEERRQRFGQAGREWLAREGTVEKWRADFLEACEKTLATSRTTRLPGLENGRRRGSGEGLRLVTYLADQNPGHDRSIGISRMSETVLGALAGLQGVEIEAITSESALRCDPQVAIHRMLPWKTRGKLRRLLTDHLHPLWLQRRERKGDVFYYPKGYLPVTSGLLKPSVVTIHDTIIHYYQKHHPTWRRRFEYAYWSRMLRGTLKRADVILTVSECSARAIRAFMEEKGMPEKEVVVTHEPCFYEDVPQPDAPEKGDYVLHFASREPHKRTEWLMEWWQAESEKRKLPQLLLVGSMSPDASAIARENPLFCRHGYVEDDELVGLISGARAVILPSEIEGFGLPALEAYYLGTPVCFTCGIAVEEILAPATSKGAFLHEGGPGLGEALEEVMAMSAEEVRECGLRLREEYAASKVAEKMMAVFR